MYKTSARLGLIGSIILLLLSVFMAFLELIFGSGDLAPVNRSPDASLFAAIAGLITSVLGIVGVKLLSVRPVLSRILLSVAAFISIILAVLMVLVLRIMPSGAMIIVYVLFFSPAALLTASLIVSLSEVKTERNDFI
jgi:hypothetical protein